MRLYKYLCKDVKIKTIDGKECGAKLWSPYAYELNLEAGEHNIEIKVTNTLANMLEFYKAPSGIEEKPMLYI